MTDEALMEATAVKTAKEIAQKLKEEKMPLEVIAKCTELPISEIEKL